MSLSGIHNVGQLETGFPIRSTSGMTLLLSSGRLALIRNNLKMISVRPRLSKGVSGFCKRFIGKRLHRETPYFFCIVFGREIPHHAQSPGRAWAASPCCALHDPKLCCSGFGRDFFCVENHQQPRKTRAAFFYLKNHGIVCYADCNSLGKEGWDTRAGEGVAEKSQLSPCYYIDQSSL